VPDEVIEPQQRCDQCFPGRILSAGGLIYLAFGRALWRNTNSQELLSSRLVRAVRSAQIRFEPTFNLLNDIRAYHLAFSFIKRGSQPVRAVLSVLFHDNNR
jgi:hypothetical protein